MTKAADNYGRVLWELKLPREDVAASERIFRDNPVLTAVFKNPTVALSQKEKAIDRIFPPSMGPFLKTVCRRGRWGEFLSMIRVMQDCEKEERGVAEAVLTCVIPPDERQTEELKNFIKKRFGKAEAELEVEEDPSLLGGFVLRTGSYEYDNSLLGKYRRLAAVLHGGERG